MSIDGIGAVVPGIIPGPREATQEVEQRTGTQFDLERRTPDSTDGALARGADEGPGVPQRPPTGADPEAWALLTDAEREFFRDPALLGPVTYGRGSIDAAMMALGSTLDVRG